MNSCDDPAIVAIQTPGKNLALMPGSDGCLRPRPCEKSPPLRKQAILLLLGSTPARVGGRPAEVLELVQANGPYSPSVKTKSKSSLPRMSITHGDGKERL